MGSQNAAQKVLDGMSYISEAVASVGSPPTRMISSWVADQIAPRYWRPNHEIKVHIKFLFLPLNCHSNKKFITYTQLNSNRLVS
jgi:zinc finger FYVE domain-containing protein 1